MERSLIIGSSDLISRCKAISAFKRFCKECDGGEACGECKIVDMVQVLKEVPPEMFSLDTTVQRPDNLGRKTVSASTCERTLESCRRDHGRRIFRRMANA